MSLTETFNKLVNDTISSTSLKVNSISEKLPSTHEPFTDVQDSIAESILNVDQGAMATWEQAIWSVIFFSIVLIASSGNIIVVYIVSTNKEMKSVTNYFLVNLSLADTMVSLLNVTFNFISMLMSNWPFGLSYCKISNFIAILSISASIFTLTAISCDRYNAIIHPLRPRMSHRHALAWIALIWTLSAMLAMPNLIFSTLVEERQGNNHQATTCAMIWPDGRYPTSWYELIYNVVIFVVTYVVPIITMAYLYYHVGKELWGHQVIGENIDKQHRALMAKKKIVKMMIVVVIIFALCWLPYQSFFIVNYYVPNLFQEDMIQLQRLYLAIYWLGMSNSMYNPIIIYFMNSKFRHEIKNCIYLLFCCRKPVSQCVNHAVLSHSIECASPSEPMRIVTNHHLSQTQWGHGNKYKIEMHNNNNNNNNHNHESNNSNLIKKQQNGREHDDMRQRLQDIEDQEPFLNKLQCQSRTVVMLQHNDPKSQHEIPVQNSGGGIHIEGPRSNLIYNGKQNNSNVAL